MGANDYLVKPFRQMEFSGKLKLMLKKQDHSYMEQRFSIGKWQFDSFGHKLMSNTEVIHFLQALNALILSNLRHKQGQSGDFFSFG
jgi:DNA-binding response OmpR family regulator